MYKDNAFDVTGPCLLERKRFEKNPNYKFVFTYKYSDKIQEIYYKDQPILLTYEEYRSEQKQHHEKTKGVYYGDAWNNKDIYN